jgi:hypothetical protein
MTAKTNDKAKKTTKAKGKPAAPKKMSALAAAAQVLAENGGAMTTKEMIEAMAARKLWESPNGKTPAATLYAAILREVTTKGSSSRFKKTEPGKFAAGGKTVTAAKPQTEEEQQAAKGKATKSKGTKTAAAKRPGPAKAPTPIPDGTAGPESLSELFRI